MKSFMKTKALCVIALSSMLMAAAPAYADTPQPTPSVSATSDPKATPTPSESVDPSADPSVDPSAKPTPGKETIQPPKYDSLSAAMAAQYANSKGTTLSEYAISNPDHAAMLLGFSLDEVKLSDMAELPTDLDKPENLNKLFKENGLTLDTSEYSNLQLAKADITSKGSSIDALVVSAGASYAEQMASLRAPSLVKPTSPGLDTSSATSMPKEGLAFGLFLDKSLTDLVTNSPDVFNEIQNSGLGTPQAQAAWKNSMMNAMSGSQKDMTSMLPSACGGVFLTAMASGSAANASKSMPSGGGCGSCLVAGLYSHGQMASLFNPELASTNPTRGTGGPVTPMEWSTMMGFQQNALKTQNPNLSSSLDNALGLKNNVAAAGCEGSSGAVTTTANSSMKKTMSFLNK